MTAEQTQLVQFLASLPLQAILLVAVRILWTALVAAQSARVDDLKYNYEKNLADLRTRVMLLEDRAGIPVPNAPISNEKGLFTKIGAKDVKLD